MRPDCAPRLGETYRDWRDFTERVCRPWIDNDGVSAQVDNWYRTLMLERDPWYVASALVFADNRIKVLEAALFLACRDYWADENSARRHYMDKAIDWLEVPGRSDGGS